MSEPTRGRRLLEVAGLFLKLGALSFGGPAAHIALMETEAVRKRGWLSQEQFLDLVAATNLVPGPNATEMAIHIGYLRAGWPGLVVAGVVFILPAAMISGLLAWAYVAYGALPQVQAIFWGINPVAVAIVLLACWRLGKTSIKEWKGHSLALPVSLLVAGVAAAFLGVDQVVILLAAGTISLLLHFLPRLRSHTSILALAPWSFSLPPSLWSPTAPPPLSLLALALFFLKVGALLFGSGMVLFAFIQRDIVTDLGWLTQQQLVDAIAVGQMTPGPVLSSVTFIGYLLGGWSGAVVSTVAVFLPSFIIMALVGPWIPRLRRWPPARAFLRGVNVAVVALMLVMAVILLRAAVVDVWTVLIGLAALVALLRFRADGIWLILGGAALGFVHYLVLRT